MAHHGGLSLCHDPLENLDYLCSGELYNDQRLLVHLLGWSAKELELERKYYVIMIISSQCQNPV